MLAIKKQAISWRAGITKEISIPFIQLLIINGQRYGSTKEIHMLKSTLLAGFVAAMVMGAAFASPDAEKSGATSSWDSYDTDKDGSISKEEAAAMHGLADLFDKIDTNKDSKLDKAELNAIHGGQGHGQGDSGHGEGHSEGAEHHGMGQQGT